ncbi:NAD(P)-dependent oxidoreductase [Brachyspira aalborgi]|uniref:NAD(P)-dependent oxidoreductase n=1 Tax=Brachyspira aalborgi TaxID=29522 RepID=A0A5C8D6M9_9SPIR|nr:NAD(P)H-binding protein [Brachyspira aalborgi]TXJ19782.1 NAD(P)-dependent oxidoreductase [Brachyspira aalborgi]
MKIAIIGATGKAGKLIMEEALKRGLDVTAIVRNKSKLSNSSVKVIEKDLFDLKKEDLKDFDTVVSAFGIWEEKELPKHAEVMNHLCDILADTNIRLMVVGGAASLYVNKEHTMILKDAPNFPEAFMGLAVSENKAFDILKDKKDVLWTYVSPSADFQAEREKTGEYNIGNDELLVNSKGESYISYADYAAAFADEIVNKKYLNQQITFCSK